MCIIASIAKYEYFLRNFCSPLHCFVLPCLYTNISLCMCFMLLFIYIHIRPLVNNKFPFFSDFAGKSRTQKPSKAQTKQANITSVQYLRAYQQVVSTLSFIIYLIFILLSHYLRQLHFFPPPLPLIEYTPTPNL